MIRRGVAAVVFLRKGDKTKYLLLKRKKNWKGWEWLKGGRKPLESESACLRREIREEIGVREFSAKKTKYFSSFKYAQEYLKDHRKFDSAKHRVYAVEVFSDKIKVDKIEHSGFKWVNRKEALRILTWPDQKRIFGKVSG
jgi:8-oxo-dGTP pyrophosphatase MutT (NUDIX family)